MASSSAIIDHSPHHPQPAAPIATASNVVLIDNYDSFTWNVYQYLVLEGATATVIRNDKVTLDALITLQPTQLVVSPGPGHPATDSGISRAAIKHFAGKIPIFGVCMGQQCIFDVFGGTVESAGEILHGKTSPLAHDERGVYAGLAQHLPVTRYHSLAGTAGSLPPSLEVTSWIAKPDGSRGVIMGVRHKEYTVEGVQFHPESILSADGRAMVRNFLLMRGGTWAENEALQKAGATQAPAPAPASSTAAPSKSTNILQQIYARRRERVAAQREIPSQRLEDLQAAYDAGAAPPALSLVDRLRQSPFPVALMAEIKRASPSKGVFAIDIRAPEQARTYAQAGASVISVLTEPDWFKGSIEDLRAVRAVLQHMPDRPAILRKEFIFDEYQILEARLAGADTVLLIVKMLDDATLARLYKYSQSLGMEPLVEVQNAEEMTRAVQQLGAKVIGVNNRNLESFEVDLKTTSRLRSMVPADTILCALSGINTRADVVENEKDGVNAVLVGEAIMRAADPAQFIRQLCSGAVPSSSSSSSSSSRTHPLLVKICGTRSAEAALEAARSGADMVGMILVPGTKRFVSDETALAISKALRDFEEEATSTTTTTTTPTPTTTTHIATDFFAQARTSFSRQQNRRPLLVGVFMNQPLDYVLAKQKLYNLDVVQLHGHEPVEWGRQIPVPVVHKFGPGEAGISQRGFHAATLLDSGSGSGTQLEVSAVLAEAARDPSLSFLFAGGLTPANVSSVLAALDQGNGGGVVARHVLGVDTSSGVETDGKQDLAKIRAFVQAAKQYGHLVISAPSTPCSRPAMAPIRPKSRILCGVTVAIAGNLGPGWSDADVARWLAYNSGRFVPSVSSDNKEAVTHLLCTRDEYEKPPKLRCANLKALLGHSPGVHIVLHDWLEDSLHKKRRRAERPYLLRNVVRAEKQTPAALQQKLAAQRERGRREGEAFVDSSLYHIYRDSTGFAYKATIRRDHPAANIYGERYVLHLFESNARPHLYWFAARHYKSRTHTQPRCFRPSGTCQLFATEFAHFCAFFRKKTGVA
ncbi:anthranilate synthase / indole-3-glycerol phosphate synthase [Sporothrix curviconia]|uniref:Multifunctional tryptophan biosynthesis protein n=1 Tax=Sporothrix curviconia TaxID=1260050 RepID=A0ABP0BGX8_9PEZI